MPRSVASMSRRAPPASGRSAVPRPADLPSRSLTAAALVIAAVLGAALLAVALGPHRVGDVFTETDFYGGYAEGARLVQQGRLDPTRYGVVGPVYEIVLGIAGFLVRDLLLAAELLSVTATAAAVLLWFLLLGRRARPGLALLAMLFLATNATLFRYGYSATTDALALALQALALWLLLARAGPRAALFAGVAAALAFLTRYNAAVLLPAGLIAIALGGTLHERRARAALLFAAGFLAPVVPWVAWSLAHGATFASQLHHNIAYDVFARARGIPWDNYQRLLQHEFPTLGHVIARDPGAVLRRELFNVGDHLRLDAVALLGWPVAIAALAGAVIAALDGTLKRLWPVWLAAGLTFLALVPVFYSPRYALALLPAYAALAAAAFSSPRLAPRPAARTAFAALALLPLGFAAQASWREQKQVFSQLPVEVLEAAPVLRGEAGPGDGVIARKPHIAYHGGVRAIPFPFTRTLPELAVYARGQNARWLWFSWPEAEMRPDYAYLLDTSAVVPGLRVRAVTRRHPAVLYEIGAEFGAVPAWLGNDTLRAMHRARAQTLINPADVRPLYLLGFIARSRGRPAEAATWLEQAARVAPRHLETAILQGEVSLLLQNPGRAADAYRRALAIDPGNVAAQAGLGWAALVARQPREAAALWRPVIGVTEDGATLRRMVELYRALGDGAAAAEAEAALARLGAGS